VPFPEQPTRRAVVLGLATTTGLTLTGCSSGEVDLPGFPDPEPAPDPDRPLVRRARRAEHDLYELVVNTRKKHRGLKQRLKAVQQAHLDHLARLTTTSSLSVLTQERPVAKSPGRALADVAAAERELARTHAATALDVRSGPLARVIASMSAAAAQQGSVLGAGDAP
jgi:hypothetical protein